MVTSLPKPTSETVSRKCLKENILTPRFYTTNFEVAASMDLSEQETELQTMLAEMRADYNRHHFVRDESFNQSWDHITGEARQAFIDYLERSCVSECDRPPGSSIARFVDWVDTRKPNITNPAKEKHSTVSFRF